ncbi:protein kinase family protein [Arthrobacter sp. Helios]|uniref:protein kinase family protein n=1 Tax=Arthrobacter sp. Helios TaxID=2828862 RepID=UPI00204D1DFC|nr:protein kinase family protein [Arthrobacter sp. Helios]UPO76392.1 protein kinase family protein [Arthrobacter sp. Helios]
MPVDGLALMLTDLKDKYEERASSPAFSRLYEDVGPWGHMFAVLHEALNDHFEAINGRAVTTRHYWAIPSRDLIELIKDLKEDLYALKRGGIEIKLIDSYQEAIERCQPWLSPSSGSPVPEDFEPVTIIKYERVFSETSSSVTLKKQRAPVELKMIGGGSYANVYGYVDPDYGIKFAVKRAKRGLSDRDLQRFRQEFDVMKRLSFPYVVEVYKFDEARNEYRMEFCDETLRAYISKRNTKLQFSTRKRVALQFLYGISYIHSQGLLHRDISLQNVLLKVFGSGAVLVKLSDFGLVKDQASRFTRTQTEMRGTIRDPQLHNFKDYDVPNEMYSIGWVLSYIFTGRDALTSGADAASRIVQKCTAPDLMERYGSVLEVIADVEHLEASPAARAATGAEA